MKKILTLILLAIVTCGYAYDPTTQNVPRLNAEAHRTRYAIAADLLRDAEMIVEIGGYRTPISDFVTDKPVVVLHPKLETQITERVKHLPLKFEEWDQAQIAGRSYAVVLLDLDLRLDTVGWEKLCTFINGATHTIIEFSSPYKRARAQYAYILDKIGKQPAFSVKLDFTEPNVQTYAEYTPCRELYSFKNAR